METFYHVQLAKARKANAKNVPPFTRRGLKAWG